VDPFSGSTGHRKEEFSAILEIPAKMSEREQIIGRIREALRLEAHRPGHAQTSNDGTRADATPRKWLPIVPGDYKGQVELFSKNCDDLKTRFLRVAALSDIVEKLSEWKNAEAWKLIASHLAPDLDAILPCIGLPILFTEDRPTTKEIERADVGITLCDALIAQTGSILLTTRSAGGRTLSVLPPHHIVIARENQLLPDLPAAFELLQKTYNENYPSLITFITGPSRTGDIERILVLGAHGPRFLTICLLPNEK
jgi:L-lactate dehydrogenase complex protein LldG